MSLGWAEEGPPTTADLGLVTGVEEGPLSVSEQGPYIVDEQGPMNVVGEIPSTRAEKVLLTMLRKVHRKGGEGSLGWG